MAEAPAITHRRVLRIALPIVLSNATVPILGAVDTAVVGQMGQAAPIGAVGLGAIVLSGIYWIFGFLRMGTVGLTAQAVGSGDTPEVSAMLSRALAIGLGAGLVLIALQTVLLPAAVALAPGSPEVEAMAMDYMRIRIWSAPAIISLYGVTGWLIARERTRAVLVLQLWMNGLNIGLDLVFVLGLGWGVEGVARATFLAEWSGLALGLWLCRDAFATPAWRDRSRLFERATLSRMAAVNANILIRSALLQGIFVSFLFLSAGQGDVTLAANQVLMQFLHITAYAMDGVAFAAEALVGQALGARDRGTLVRAVRLSGFWAGVVVVALALGFALGGGALIDLMTTAPDVRAEARRYLYWMVLGPLAGWAPWLLDGVFIGATRTADMRNMMALSAALYALALALLVPAFGNDGLWGALVFSFLARGATLAVRMPALLRAVS